MFRHLGTSLVLIRRLQGLKAAQLAERCAMAPHQLALYEQERRLPHLSTLERVLNGLGVGDLELALTLALLERRSGPIAAGPGPARQGPGPSGSAAGQVFPLLAADILKLHRLCESLLVDG